MTVAQIILVRMMQLTPLGQKIIIQLVVSAYVRVKY